MKYPLILTQGLLLAVVGNVAAQCNLEKFIAGDITGPERFGKAVDLDAGRLLVGTSSGIGVSGLPEGAAYLFERQGGHWVQTAKLHASDGHTLDLFGSCTSVQGSRAIAGAPQHDHCVGETCYEGAVYVFEEEASGWTQKAELLASDGAIGLEFGYAAALDGNRVLVGAAGSSQDAGKAYVFEYDGNSWSQVQLVPSHAGPGDFFGTAVALEGDIAVITAPQDDEYWSSYYHWRGTIYVFERQGDGTWIQTARLTSPEPNIDYGWYGWSVAINDGRILGTHLYLSYNHVREAHFYDKQSGVWQWTSSIAPNPPWTSDNPFHSVDLDGDRAAISGGSTDPASDAVYVFHCQAGQWSQVARADLGGTLETEAAQSPPVSLDGDWIAIGSPGDDAFGLSAGAVYTLSLPQLAVPYCFGANCPCGNEDPIAGCINSTGVGAWLAACGSTSIGADDLVLDATNLPTNQFGIFFMGFSQLELPFGDGLQCVGAGGMGIFRYSPPQNSGSTGSIALGPGIVARSQTFSANGRIAGGDTWNFQAWYRDPMGSPCGAFFNLSNAISITFAQP